MLNYTAETVMKSLLPIGKNADTLEKEVVRKGITAYSNTLNQRNVETDLGVDTGHRVDVGSGISLLLMFLLVR